MNEGCEGGYPILHGLFLENGYLVEESCAAYSASSSTKCADFSSCAPVVKIKSSSDVGRGSGDSSERKIIKELLRNGAVVTEMDPGLGFETYKEGIYSTGGNDGSNADGSISDKTLKD